MSDTAGQIQEPTLRELASTRAIASVCVMGQPRGFSVRVDCGSEQRVLGTSRGSVREFASLNTLATFLQSLGLSKFQVDVSDYQPGRLRKPRPDRSVALQGTRTRPRQKPLL